MALVKKASGIVLSPYTSSNNWSNVRVASGSSPQKNLIHQASDIFGKKFSPDDYILTHCTIVASVDVDNAPGVKVGSFREGARNLLRRWNDYYITPGTAKYINNNNDSFEREVLKRSFDTFIGAHNFLEHVQIEEQSKGRIIDTYARDIGDSLYIDILVATDKKHEDLIRQIQSGALGTLSMGCKIEHSTCSKCGNVAKDESEMCEHILYQKGNKFFDESGTLRKVAELCGHKSEPGNCGVEFIEASWVKIPAFTGAVLRSFVEAGDMAPGNIEAMAQRLASNPREFKFYEEAFTKAASMVRSAGLHKQADPFADDEGEEKPKATDIQKFKDKVVRMVLDEARSKIEEEFKGKQEPDEAGAIENPNDNLIREANSLNRQGLYNAGLDSLVRVASTDYDLMSNVALYNSSLGINIPRELYRVALKLGPYRKSKYASVGKFISASKRHLCRTPTKHEAELLIKLSTLLGSWQKYKR